MKKATPTQILMIAAVRADPEVGRGTGSSIERHFDNDELLDLLVRRGAADAASAVQVARGQEEIHRIRVETKAASF